jgi:hypothetical protein
MARCQLNEDNEGNGLNPQPPIPPFAHHVLGGTEDSAIVSHDAYPYSISKNDFWRGLDE